MSLYNELLNKFKKEDLVYYFDNDHCRAVLRIGYIFEIVNDGISFWASIVSTKYDGRFSIVRPLKHIYKTEEEARSSIFLIQ